MVIGIVGSSQRRNAAMLDSSDTDSLSSSSTARSEMLVSSGEEVQLDKDTVLDQCLDALYEKRGATREKALASLIDVFNSNMQHEYVEKKFATLLHQCLNSIKKGSSREIALASHFIGLLALTTGSGSKAQEILEESITPISEALKSRSDASRISSLLECLAIITFIGGEEPEETEKSMQLMWQIIHPKMGPNVSSAKPSSPIITAVVSAWTFLLTTMNGWTLNPKSWQESISYFSSLLDKDDRSVRIAAGEALALIFEVGNLEKFAGEAKGSGDGSTYEGSKSRELVHIQGLRSKAGGKGSAKKDLNSQRNTFRDIQEFLEYGYSPETSMKIAGESLDTTTWGELIQLNFLKHFLGGGFVKHMQVCSSYFSFQHSMILFLNCEPSL
nr:interferon-related developmental regulator 1-like [Ipomoea batatas]